MERAAQTFGREPYCGGICKLVSVAPGDHTLALSMDAGGVFVGTAFGRVVGVLFGFAPPLAQTTSDWLEVDLKHSLKRRTVTGRSHLDHRRNHRKSDETASGARHTKTNTDPTHPVNSLQSSPWLCDPPAFRTTLYAAHSDGAIRFVSRGFLVNRFMLIKKRFLQSSRTSP